MLEPTYRTEPREYKKIRALAYKFWELQLPRAKLDLIVATGDLTTDGSDGALRTALGYFTEKLPRIPSPIKTGFSEFLRTYPFCNIAVG